MAAIYDADIYCDDCVDAIKERLQKVGVGDIDIDDETSYDSGEYPKYCSDDEESDSPQHCAAGEDCLNAHVMSDGTKIGYFFANNLTTDGEEYVKEAVKEDRANGNFDSVACEVWAEYYDYIDFDLEGEY